MTPAKLIKILSQYPQDEEIDFLFNPCKNDVEEYDISVDIEIMGDTETTPTIMITPKIKPARDFETIEELLSENPEQIRIEIEKTGIYVFSNNELRREIELKVKTEKLHDASENIIKKLVEIL